MITTTDEQPHIREQDGYQWMMFHCAECGKKIWLYYGHKDDMSAAEPDGYKCCYCQTDVIAKHNYELLEYIYDKRKDDEKWIRSRMNCFDTEKKCPITEKANEYDPKEREMLMDKIDKVAELLGRWERKEIDGKELYRLYKDIPGIDCY